MKLYLSDIIKKQAIINAGIIGHVSHGKSTLTRKLTGTKTQRHSSEKNTNDRTVKLGYANAKIFINPANGFIKCTPSSVQSCFDPVTGQEMILAKHISFPDCPGHDEFMITMLGGSSIMDMAILVVASNQPIPQPQTYEHLLAIAQTNIKEFLVVHNKLDLISYEEAKTSYKELINFLSGSPAEHATIIPMSAELEYNLDKVYSKLLELKIKDFPRSYNAPARMNIVRSFNVNKPNTNIFELKGAVVGGSIYQGILSKGDRVELRPGILKNGLDGKPTLQPLIAIVKSIQSDEKHELEHAIPGGLIGVELTLDSGFSTADKLVGFQLGHVGTLSNNYTELSGKIKILQPDHKFTVNDKIKISILALSTTATITAISKKKITIKTDMSVTIDIGSKVAILVSNKLVAVLTVESGALLYKESYPHGYNEFKESWHASTFDVIDDIPDFNPTCMTTDMPCMTTDMPCMTTDMPCMTTDYDEMLKNIIFKEEKTKTDRSIKLKPVQINYPNKHHVEVTNIMEIIKALDHNTNADPHAIDVKELMLDFFKAELSDTARYNKNKDGNDQLLIYGKKKLEDIQSIVNKLITTVFKCTACNTSCRTVIFKLQGERLYERRCLECPSITHMKTLFN